MEITVAGLSLSEFDTGNVRLKYDSAASVFTFRGYFDPNNDRHKTVFRPGAYHRCKITHRGVLLLTGTLLSPSFEDGPEKEWSDLSGYSTPGILDDSCILNTTDEIIINEEDQTANIPDTAMEFSNTTLENIAKIVTAKYGIVVRVDKELKADPIFNIPFGTLSNTKIEQSVTNYLDELCKKKNVVMSHNQYGELVLTRPKADKVVTTKDTKVAVVSASQDPFARRFSEQKTNVEEVVEVDRVILWDFDGGGGALKMKLAFNGQAMHRVIQVVKQISASTTNASTAQADGSYVNPYVPFNSNGLRFKRVVQQQGDGSELQPTARMIVGDELKNIVLTIEVQGLTLGGHVITPNQMITVRNPDLHLYKKSKWFIQEVELMVNKSEEKAILTCVLPECFNSEKIKNVFS